jgi:hypothetical protein
MKTFTKELTWVGWDIDKENPDSNETIEVERTKTATFKELSRTDETQHKLIFKISELFDSKAVRDEEGNTEVDLNSASFCDLIKKAVKDLLITDKDFTEQDKREFLQDALGLMSFGFWMLQNHFTPFFSKFNPS